MNLLLPSRSLIISHSLQYIFEIVKSKYPCAFIQNKQRQVVHFHIYFRRQSDSGPPSTQRDILHNEELVLQPDKFVISRWHLKISLLLEYLIVTDGSRIEKDAVGLLHPVISHSIEISLSVRKQRNVNFTGSDSLVTTHRF